MRIFTCLFAAIGFVGVLLIGAFVCAGYAAKSAIETAGPKLLGTGVTAEGVSLSPVSGSARVGGLRVANPEGFKTDAAFRVGEFEAKVDVLTLFSDPVVVKEISVDGAEVTWEYAAGGSNLSRILEKLGSGGGGERKVIVRRFVMRNCRVRIGASVLQGKAATVPMPDLELKDIGEKTGGETAAEAARQILEKTIENARAALKDVPGALNGGGVELVKEKAKSLGGKIGDGLKSAVNRVRETVR